MWRILKQHRIDPALRRTSLTWTQFLRSQAAVACDFVTVDTALLRRYYLLFFIDVTNREVLYGGITANPTGAWTTQAARNLFVRHPDRFTHTRALVRDRASQFVNDFDEIFRSEGLKILRTPVRVPVANAFAERWIGTLRRELLDRTIIWNRAPTCVLKGSDDDVEDRRHDPCCASDGGRSSGVAVQAEIPNHRRLRRSRAGVVSAAGDVSL